MSNRLDDIRTANIILKEELSQFIHQTKESDYPDDAGFISSEIIERISNAKNEIYCYQCGDICREVYQVRVVNSIGKTSYEKVCKIECGEELQEHLYSLHIERAESMKDQVFQRLK